MDGIKYSFYNFILFSGSSDGLRNTLGGYWQIVTDSDTNFVTPTFTSVDSNCTTDGEVSTFTDSLIKEVKSGYAQSTTSSADITVPSFKMPIRLVGNKDLVEDDFHWQSKINDIYTAGANQDTSFDLHGLYQPIYLKQQDYNNFNNYKLGKINYIYNYYLPTYQTFITTQNILSLPNYYFYVSKNLGLEEDESINNYVSIEGTQDSQAIMNTVETIYPPTYDITGADIELTNDTFLDKLYKVKKYFSSSFSVEGALSASTIQGASIQSENLYFNKESHETISLSAIGMKEKFPFMITINFPVEDHPGPYSEMILNSGYENLMLNYIKRKFVDQRTDSNNFFQVVSQDITSSARSIFNRTRNTPGIVPQIDFFAMPLDTLMESSKPNPDNFHIVGGQSEERNKIINTNGTNCYAHTVPSLKLMDSVKKYLNDNFYFSNTQELLFKDILDRASLPKNSEVIAYRIQKSTGVRTISDASSTAVQNFIISNCNPQSMRDSSEERSGLTIYDSQVKYAEPYSYVVYAYVAVEGYSYSYDDLKITREIANSEDASSNTVHCLEFFEAGSGLASPALYSEDAPTDESFENDLFTEAQISSYHKYLADFNITVEPSIKICEIPIFNKTVTILDHPLPGLNTHKFQRMNDSKILGFFNNVEPFVAQKYPTPLTIDDVRNRSDYLLSNDLLQSEKISLPSRAKPSSVQIFRKTEKPKSIFDFNQTDFISEKSLKIKNTPFVVSNCLYEQMVNVNTKYYYIFRAKSDNNTIGQTTNVIEAELIDDGGYLYSVFNEFSEGDFHTAVENQISEQFKKLIHLVPNINQISFDDTNVNYQNSAVQEFDNLKVGTMQDSIFGKTFKIRLTSKKTGKKIDLNVTYKLV